MTKDLHLTEFQKIIKKLIINLYADNFTNRFNRVLDAIQFCDQSKIVIADATFILKKWVTNSKKIENFIDNQFEEGKTSENTH